MKVGASHLTYCTNIHPGESWEEVRANLARHLPAVKRRISPGAPFGIGLRLSAVAVQALQQEAAWKAMHKALDVDLTKDLRRVRSPQLILIGDRGPLGKDTDYASGWKEVQRLCPDAKLSVIEGAEGTFLPITHPGEVAKEV